MANDPRFGKLAKDRITGFQGTIIALSSWITGCDQLALAPKHEPGKDLAPAQWFDEGRVEIIGEGVTTEAVKSPLKGGPQTNSPVRY